jgi:hypothetical protein
MMKTILETTESTNRKFHSTDLDVSCDLQGSANKDDTPMTPSTAAMQELIQAELALILPIDEVAEVIFTSVKQELEDHLGNELLPVKDSNEYNGLLQWWIKIRSGTNTLMPLQSRILQFKHLLPLIRDCLAMTID